MDGAPRDALGLLAKICLVEGADAGGAVEDDGVVALLV
jgi:hypothetical protein